MTKNYDDFRAGILRAAEMARDEFKRAPEAAKGHDCVYMSGYEDACDHLSALIAQAAVIDSVRIAGSQPDWQYHIALLLPDDAVEDAALLKIYQVVEHELGLLQSQLEQLRAENERLEKVIALWFGPNSCSVCGGAPLASGKPCVCGGKGTMQAEHEGLRQALYDADLSGTKIQQERDSLRGTLSALNNCRNKPVCGHCNALLREAMKSQYQGEM